jgi:uncharacterized damage-inducible protein DinB
MIEKTPWQDRTFPFGLPVSMFADVLERLRGTPARIEDRLDGIPSARLVAKTGAAWSIQETVGHLVLVEELWIGRVEDLLTATPVLRAAAYDAGQVPAARFNERSIAGILQAFREARSRHVGALARLATADVERTALHPRLNRQVNVLDMMVFAAEHDDHHLARITEILGGS